MKYEPNATHSGLVGLKAPQMETLLFMTLYQLLPSPLPSTLVVLKLLFGEFCSLA
jgi:hypothetical protein